MSRYHVEIEHGPRKAIAAIRDRRLRGAIEAAVLALGDEPRPPGVKKLVGREGLWRVRVEDWRVVYRIEDGRLVVLVVAVARRAEVYR